MRIYRYLPILLVVTITACKTVGPEYSRPAMDAVDDKLIWRAGEAPPGPQDVIQADWWTNFQDPYLDQLIQTAISRNFDLKILMARIRQAEAQFKETQAERAPKLGLEGGSNISEVRSEKRSEEYTLGAQLSWEIDIWGKKKRAALATRAGYQARGADYRAGYLKLVADLAEAYFELRQKDQEVNLTASFYERNVLILKIYQMQFTEGIVAKDKVLRQEAQVKTLEQNLLEQKRERAVLENRIATLMGKPAGEFNIPAKVVSNAIQPVDVPVGLPSDLLSRRPDIIAAEYRILEATNRIGEAEAARLPSISLTANGGYVSSALNNLLSQWTLGIAPKINFPIFDGGRRKARVESTKAEAESATNTYLKTVMTAFEEVENSLTNLASRKKQRVLLIQKADSLIQIRSQSLVKIEMGLMSQLEVLDLEQELFQSQKSILLVDRQLLSDTVTLYKALGGGWPSETVGNQSSTFSQVRSAPGKAG